ALGECVGRSGLVADSRAGGGVVPEVSARQSWKSRVVSAVLNMLRPVYRTVYWPDAVYHWLPFLFFQLWKRRHKKYDVIVSYYPMFESLIGGWLWMRMNRNGDTRWIVDYGDPFSISDSQRPNNYAIYRKLNFFVERSVLRSASAVVMLQDNLAARYLAAGLVEREKLHVIPHVVDIDSFYAGEASGVRENKKEIRVVYVGALHKDIREPGKLDLLFKQLNLDDSRQKIVLDMFGRTGGIDVHWSDVPQIRHYGLVSREEASRQMSGADVLLIIGNDNCDMVPSKLTEYVATGRAIISFQGNAPGDESIKRYAKYGRVMEIDKHDPSSWDVDSIRH